MGEIILGPEWLMLECHSNKTAAPPAREIYRAYILHRKRSGHVLDLDAQEARRQVQWGLNKGRVQHFMVRCARCGCVAWLPDWIRAVNYTQEQRAAILADNPEQRLARRLTFLNRCPGGSYKPVVHTDGDWPEVL